MKHLRPILLLIVLVALALPLTPRPTVQAQAGPWLQVWIVGEDHTFTVEYRDATGQTLASFQVNNEFNTARQAGGRVFGSGYNAIPILDPATGQVTYDQLTGLEPDTDQVNYWVSPPVPTADGQSYVYTVTQFFIETLDPAISSIYQKPVGSAAGTLLYQEQMAEAWLTLEPVGFTDDGTLILHEMPNGIGGYILFWKYRGVRLLAPGATTTQSVEDMHGFSSDGQTFAAILIADVDPTFDIFPPSGSPRSAFPVMGLPETPATAGDATFSPSNTRIAFQLARQDPENEVFWTVVFDTLTKQHTIVLEDQADRTDLNYGHIGGWLDDNTLVVGDVWSGKSAIIDVTTDQILREANGAFLGYAVGITDASGFAGSGPASASCPGAPLSRLQTNARGRVTFTNGLPVNVRQVPGGEQIGSAPEGTEFAVIAGPDCQDGYAWWYVRFDNGLQGYVAEGDADGYYLEPWQ
jgi:hypothetical protein